MRVHINKIRAYFRSRVDVKKKTLGLLSLLAKKITKGNISGSHKKHISFHRVLYLTFNIRSNLIPYCYDPEYALDPYIIKIHKSQAVFLIKLKINFLKRNTKQNKRSFLNLSQQKVTDK